MFILGIDDHGLKLPDSSQNSIDFFENDTFESVIIKRGKVDRPISV